jgi:hypothetical protein
MGDWIWMINYALFDSAKEYHQPPVKNRALWLFNVNLELIVNVNIAPRAVDDALHINKNLSGSLVAYH